MHVQGIIIWCVVALHVTYKERHTLMFDFGAQAGSTSTLADNEVAPHFEFVKVGNNSLLMNL